jgi:hypothetical protein
MDKADGGRGRHVEGSSKTAGFNDFSFSIYPFSFHPYIKRNIV